MRCGPGVALVLFLVAELMTTSPVQAGSTVWCAGDVNVLNTALKHAESAANAGYITTIELAQGVYDVSNTELTSGNAKPYGVKLLGGYGPSCATRSLAPASTTQGNTVLDGGGNAAFLDLFGSLTIEGVQFRNFSAASGLGVHLVEEQPTTVNIRYDIFSSTGLQIDTGHGANVALGVYNNLIDQSLPGRDGLVINAVNAGDQVTITGNTIGYAGNDGVYLCQNAASGGANLYNNIVWANAGFDINVSCVSGPYSSTAVLVDNTYSTAFVSGASGSGGNSNDNPLFVGSGNYRLKTAPTLSPAVNSGYAAAPGISDTDLDGNARSVGSAPDRGAYESSYDDTAGNVLTVTNTGDNGGVSPTPGAGTGTLRQAIVDANQVAVLHFIHFDIPGGCPETITLSSTLPAPKYGLVIDGFTQPGSHANTLDAGDNAVRCIVLDGGGSIITGLAPFSAAGQQFWVQGLAFEGFHDTGGNCYGSALNLSFGSSSGAGAIVQGNQFGGTLNGSGPLLAGNDSDIVGGDYAAIGGHFPAQRNIIAGAKCTTSGAVAAGYGIIATVSAFIGGGGSNMSIVGNLIGTDATESTSVGNDYDVYLQTNDSTIDGNVIVNASSGIVLQRNLAVSSTPQASGNTITNNRIGITYPFCTILPPTCFEGTPAANSRGILLSGTANDNTIARNTIWDNYAGGVELLVNGSFNPQRNVISQNSINVNNPTYGGIYTGYPVNFTYNDADPSVQAQPNRGLNSPVVTRAIGGPGSGTLSGTLASTNAIYNIEVFASQQCDTGGYGEGQTYLTSQGTSITNAPSGNNGSTTFEIPIAAGAAGSLAGQQMTLTATDADGNTSVFSKCYAYVCDVVFRQGFDSAAGEKCP